MKIIWIVSYPKSGNTFIRFLLANYLYGKVTSSLDVTRRIPDLHVMMARGECLNTEVDEPLLMKTHFMLSDNHPYLAQTAGFIYVLRNPRDVLLSNSRYSGVTDNQDIDVATFARTFIRALGVPRWRSMGMGTWLENVGSWLAASHRYPHLFIKYEDLKQRTPEYLRDMVKFIDAPLDEARLAQAVEQSSLASMRGLEQQEKQRGEDSVFDEQGATNLFVGQGRSGQSLVHLGNDVEDYYRQRFGKSAALFGYD